MTDTTKRNTLRGVGFFAISVFSGLAAYQLGTKNREVDGLFLARREPFQRGRRGDPEPLTPAGGDVRLLLGGLEHPRREQEDR